MSAKLDLAAALKGVPKADIQALLDELASDATDTTTKKTITYDPETDTYEGELPGFVGTYVKAKQAAKKNPWITVLIVAGIVAALVLIWWFFFRKKA
jgi:cytochrome oxidase Cu insertion factor (SCO1/SenC/PrrC family)